jgi:hypothetical protein
MGVASTDIAGCYIDTNDVAFTSFSFNDKCGGAHECFLVGAIANGYGCAFPYSVGNDEAVFGSQDVSIRHCPAGFLWEGDKASLEACGVMRWCGMREDRASAEEIE